MLLQKSSLPAAVLTLFFFSCIQHGGISDTQRVEEILHRRFLQGDSTRPFFVYVLNPHDCFVCLRVAKGHFGWMAAQGERIPPNNVIFVLPVMRQIEREKFISELLPDDKSYEIVSDDALVAHLRQAAGREKKVFTSFLIVYNATREILFAKVFTDEDFEKLVRKAIGQAK